jgi:CMP/dCMP kinase
MIDQPSFLGTDDDCFLCRPEDWRVIYWGQHVRVIAGLGSLIRGYVLLAPVEHIPTTVELPAAVFEEFKAVELLLLGAFRRQYGPTYTCYEHGRLGSCRVAEVGHATHTFCFHAHRVYIPERVELPDIERSFGKVAAIDSIAEFRRWKDGPYVYYETGPPAVRRILADAPLLPSQFMRRLISTAKGIVEWDWSADTRLLDVALTVRALRVEFAGLDYVPAQPTADRQLPVSICIDGYSGAGKSSMARMISQRTGAPYFNTGIVFRELALQHGRETVSIDHLIAAVRQGDRPELRTDDVSIKASELAAIEENRTLHNVVRDEISKRYSPCIVTGRDTWLHNKGGAVAFRLDASPEVRAKRLFLQQAREGITTDLAQVIGALAKSDSRDAAKLPADGQAIAISNDSRPYEVVVNEIMDLAGAR